MEYDNNKHMIRKLFFFNVLKCLLSLAKYYLLIVCIYFTLRDARIIITYNTILSE